MGLLDDLRRQMRKNERTTLLTEENPDFWRNVQVGQMVVLNDLQALMDASKLTTPGQSMDYLITRRFRVDTEGGVGEYLFFELEGGGEILLMMVKIVGNLFEVRLYFQVPEIQEGNRLDFVRRDPSDDWLFLPPLQAVPDRRLLQDFPPIEWIYTPDIQAPIKDKMGERTVTFLKKDIGEVGGECEIDSPDGEIDGPLLATIAEYLTSDQTLNPELLILEIGSVLDPFGEPVTDGGLIRIYFGASVKLSEVEVLSLPTT